MRLTQPLHSLISTVFLGLILLIGGLIGWHGYRTSVELLQTSTRTQSEHIGQQIQEELRRTLEPAEISLRLLRHHAIASTGTQAERMTYLSVLVDALNASPAVSAIYFGYANGDFFLLRRLDQYGAGWGDALAKARYLVQSIAHNDAHLQGHYIYLDAAREVVLVQSVPDYAQRYDPRNRDWWKQAQGTSDVVRTAPYMFYIDQSVGITLAARAGTTVVGADIGLATLGSVLARQKVTSNTQLALVDADGALVAHERISELLANTPAASGGLPPVLALQSPALQYLVEHGALSQNVPLQAYRDAANDNWYTTAVTVPTADTSALHLLMAIPSSELMSSAREELTWSASITLLVMALSVPITWLLARLVSQPLRRLVNDVDAIRHFDFSQPIAANTLIQETRDLALTLQDMQSTIRHFLELSMAVASEENFERLLPRLLSEAMYAARAHAGVLYLVDETRMIPSSALRSNEPPLTANALSSLAVLDMADSNKLQGSGAALALALTEGRGGVHKLTGADMRALHLGAAGLTDDMQHGIAIPLANRRHENVGAMLLLLQVPPDEAQVAFVTALSGAAAVTLEARALIQSQKALFQSLIELIASAIDAKSPYTGSHCARVPELTKMLAQAACEQTEGPFADFKLNDQDWEAVHVAAWLHDCGKVTTPEYVVDKSTKLETIYDRIHEVRMRFEVLKRDAVIAMHEAIASGQPETEAIAAMTASLQALDDDFAFVAACNDGDQTLSPEQQARLKSIAQRSWQRTLDDRLGISHEERHRKAREPARPLPTQEPLLADRIEHRFERAPQDRIAPDNPWGFKLDVPELLYNRGELHNLLVPRGTLTEEDRYKVNEHIVQTIKMLSCLPLPKHLRSVPEIAGGHHEKMDGTGYPRRLRREDMSPVARMMAIADIFEALTAVDRPYKKGKTLSEALDIMARMSRDQHIDHDLFALFLRSGVCQAYAQRHMAPELIDTIHIEDYLR